MRKSRVVSLSAILVVFFALVAMLGQAEAQAPRDATYFCAGDASGGISYNASQKKWDSARFRVNEKFVLRLKFDHSRKEKVGVGGSEGVLHEFLVTLTPSGSNAPVSCQNYFRGGRDKTIQIIGDRFICFANLSQYIFNVRTNRFLMAYLQGYVDGEDNNNDTPAVVGGTCTKIE